MYFCPSLSQNSRKSVVRGRNSVAINIFCSGLRFDVVRTAWQHFHGFTPPGASSCPESAKESGQGHSFREIGVEVMSPHLKGRLIRQAHEVGNPPEKTDEHQTNCQLTSKYHLLLERNRQPRFSLFIPTKKTERYCQIEPSLV
ncbi:hypothetical protein RB195_019781 [Necator americanus]|uniref:Uncharacterized protein n=1 Tax=Necator americanus TaxID=51031 RepID=A0ABR1CFT4_NECAM